MAYIGNTAASKFVSNRAASVYSGDGSTVAFTLEQVVTQDEDVLVSVDGVVQEPSVAYAVSSGTTLTFTAAPSNNAGNNIFVYYLASQAGTIGHPSTQGLTATTGTFSGNVVIPNGGNIGSAGDTDAISIASNGVVTFSQTPVGDNVGKILQVVAVHKATAFTSTSTSFVDITGFTASITPSSTSSKILVMSTINGSQDVGANRVVVRLLRDSTVMMGATGNGDRLVATSGITSAHADLIGHGGATFLDSPSSTSTLVYKWQGIISAGSGTFFINRSENDTDNAGYARFGSSMVLMEVAG